MYATTVGVDVAKNRFEVAVADEQYRIPLRRSFTRAQFERWIAQQPPSLFVMEACGSTHYWGRRLLALGHAVKLLPAQYVRAYVKRNKTDRADAAALIEASRCADIKPVPVKTPEQQQLQQLQQLHRLREQYKRTRNMRINLLRGVLREYGIGVPKGVVRGLAAVREALELADNDLPEGLRPWIAEVLEEIALFGKQMSRVERQIEALTREVSLVKRWMEAPGVGPLFASALYASAVDLQRFPSGRHLSSWLGVTPGEHSSGERRRLGRISKHGDTYLRMLLVNGARSALYAAERAKKASRPLDPLQRWALRTKERRGMNKATVAFANKLARIVWAIAKHDRRFDRYWSTRPREAA